MLYPGQTILATPEIKVLSQDQKEIIYNTALDIMETAGVRVEQGTPDKVFTQPEMERTQLFLSQVL